jgi:hypothetical protein
MSKSTEVICKSYGFYESSFHREPYERLVGLP